MQKLCEYDLCQKKALYGYRYKKPERCKKHKVVEKIFICSNGEYDNFDKIM